MPSPDDARAARDHLEAARPRLADVTYAIHLRDLLWTHGHAALRDDDPPECRAYCDETAAEREGRQRRE